MSLKYVLKPCWSFLQENGAAEPALEEGEEDMLSLDLSMKRKKKKKKVCGLRVPACNLQARLDTSISPVCIVCMFTFKQLFATYYCGFCGYCWKVRARCTGFDTSSVAADCLDSSRMFLLYSLVKMSLDWMRIQRLRLRQQPMKRAQWGHSPGREQTGTILMMSS